jgi:UDP-N-acetylmuramoyl-tripeptide--D-alanyl-D-alanine ligase
MKTEQLYNLFKESTGISTDSRSVKPGQIFFALRGENFNGNRYAGDAISKGALIAVIDDPVFKYDKTFLVDDTLVQLQELAKYYRNSLDIPVLAITGTNGKTTTKELIAAVLSRKLRVHYTKGNLNNEIGVPVTILSAPVDTEMLIIEMGANHLNEIRKLCEIVRPGFGLITNIGRAHLEGFGSYEGVIKAKSELYEYLNKVNGISFYNDQNQLLTDLILKSGNRAVPYSDPAGTELRIEPVPSKMNVEVMVIYGHKSYGLKSLLFGHYNLDNIKAAIATGLFFKVRIDDIIDAIEEYKPGNNRSQVRITSKNTLICDSYNANPVSMLMAIQSFSGIEGSNKLIILGDMLELGERSEDEHARILEEIEALGLTEVLLVGKYFKKSADPKRFRTFSNVEELEHYLKHEPVQGKTVLIKGSRGMTLEKIYDVL